MIHVFVINKISRNSNNDSKDNKTIYNIQELHLFLFSLTIFTSSIFSVHSSTSLSTNFSLHLQFC